MNHNTSMAGAPPHSIEAEQSVLGAIMRFNDAFDRVGDLQDKHFYREDHREIYKEIVLLVSRGQPADTMTVLAALQARGNSIMDGIGPYLNQIAQSVPSAANVAQYAATVTDRALLRAAMHVADTINGLAQNPKGKTADQVLDTMQSLVTRLAERRVRNEPRMIRDVLVEFIDGATQRADGLESAMSTGIEELDRLMNGGARPGQLIIVAGRPSMGKTALAADIGLTMASSYSVLMFSMEMGSQEIAGRALANRGRVALSHVMGRIADDDTTTWAGVTHGCIKLDDIRFAIDDTPAITMLELRMKAKAWKRRHGLHAIVVDYIGLMAGGDGEKRHEQIGSYSRGLKELAKELGVAVIALAQLNRKSEDRPDRRPILSDLRDSGEIEQDADVVMFVHRPEMHAPENTMLRGYAEVMVRKQRSGALGDIPMMFDGPTCRFSGWEGAIPSQLVPRSRGRKEFDA